MRFRFDDRQLATLRQPALRPRDAITFGVPIGNPVPCPNHYVVDNHREAYRRVLWSNPTPQHDRSKDVVGDEGHLERANAYTHLAAAVLFVAYSVARVWIVDHHSFASQLSGVAIAIAAFMFATSVMYHVFKTVPGCAHAVRNIDYLAIYMAMGIAGAADCALVTNDLQNVPFQCLLDPILATTVLGSYFSIRRMLVPSDETVWQQFEDSCQLGLFRFEHSDLEHAPLRTSGVTVLMTFWIFMLPAAMANLSVEVLVIYVLGRVVSSTLLLFGVLFDNTFIPDKALAGREPYWDRAGVACGCASKQLGCVMNAHAWWHVLALVATIILVASREYGISQMAH